MPAISGVTATWNDAGTTFDGIKLTVTDTASQADSDIVDLVVTGSGRFQVVKDGQMILTTADAATSVGPNGATNPAFQIDCSTSSMATGLKITGKAAAGGVALAAISSGTNEALDIDAKGSGAVNLAPNSTGGATYNGPMIGTSASATALALGANGSTNPVLQVDASTSSVATGWKLTGAAAAGGVALAAISSGTNENATIDSKGSGTVTINGTATGAVVIGSLATVSSSNANALAVGPNGATNPCFNVNANTGSAATGVNVTGAAAGGGVAVAAISSGTNEAMTIDGKGTGGVTINGTATGNITLGAGVVTSTQSLSGAGAVNLTSMTTFWTTTAADAGTLADGVAGQIKRIIMVADGGDGTLTPTNFGNGTTITFADVGDAVDLQFDGTNWWVVGSQGAPAIA